MVHFNGCPGSRDLALERKETGINEEASGSRASRLRQWPVQLHLLSPQASYFKGTDLLLAADCVAYAYGDFHKDLLAGHSLAIACPKLDQGQDIYVEKLAQLIDQSEIKSITVAIMEVPCCMGLLHLARQALEKAQRKVSLNRLVVGVQGEVLAEERV